MSFDYEKANVRLNQGNGTGAPGADGTAGSITGSVSNQNNRALDQANASHQVTVNNSAFGGRFCNIANEDWSSGVFIGHIGHNSPYRTFTAGFGRWRFFSGGSTTTDYVQYDTFSIATISDVPLTLAHVVDLNAPPSSSSGTFDPTDVTRVQYQEQGNAAASNTTIVMFSFFTRATNDESLSSTPRIYDTTTIEDWVREIRNDNLGFGLGGPTNNGKLSEAVENSATTLTLSVPVAFGKSGSTAVIDGSNFIYQIGKDWTLVHVTGQGVLWVDGWDLTVPGQSLDMSNSTVNMLASSDWTVFNVDSGNVTFSIGGLTINNSGSMRFGSSTSAGALTVALDTGKLITSNCPIDNWNITGGNGLLAEQSVGTLVNLTANRLELTSTGSNEVVLDGCSVTEIVNETGTDLVLILRNGSAQPTLSGTDAWVAVIDETANTLDAFSQDISFDIAAPSISESGGTVTVPSSRTETLVTTGIVTAAAATTLSTDVENEFQTATPIDISAGVNIGQLAITSGTANVDISALGTINLLDNDTGAGLTYVGEPTALEGAWAQRNPSSFTLTADSGDVWAIYDDAGALVTSGADDVVYNNDGATDSGVWSIVIHRLGHVASIVSWQTDDGSTNAFTFSPVEIIRPEGGSAYSGGPTTGLIALRNGDDFVEIQVPNAGFTPQQIVDAQQDFLHTAAGLDFIFDTGVTSAPTWGLLSGSTFFLSITGFQYDSIAGATPESRVEALLVSSAANANVRTDNGGTVFGGAAEVDPSSLAQAVWDYLMTNATTPGSTGAALTIINDGVQNASILVPHSTDLT